MKRITVRLVNTRRDGWLLKWRCPDSGEDRQQKCTGVRQNQRIAEKHHLESSLNNEADDPTIEEFWIEYEADHLADQSKGHRDKCRTMKNRLLAVVAEKHHRTARCAHVDARTIQSLKSKMSQSGVERATVRSNMGTLWSMISWGQDHGYFSTALRKPKEWKTKKKRQAEKRIRKSKGRSLTGEEIDRLIDAIPQVKRSFERSQQFIDAVHIMRLTGMRLSEVWRFSWVPGTGRHYPVRLETSSPAIQFDEVQKSGEEQLIPITNAAAAYLRSIERGESEWICRTIGQRGEHKTANRLGIVLSKAGSLARIKVKSYESGKVKFASAHDLRRTFAQELVREIGKTDARYLTRHKNESTLVENYLDEVVEELATPELIAKLQRIALREARSGGFLVDENFGKSQKPP